MTQSDDFLFDSGFDLPPPPAAHPPRGGLLARVRPVARSAWRWVKVYWPLVAVLWAGLTRFRVVIIDSIQSTPHPQLVYAIFVVAAVATVLFGLSLRTYDAEHSWLARYKQADADTRLTMTMRRAENAALTPVWRTLDNTYSLPLDTRRAALEDELNSAETELFATLGLPNLLAGSLVGLGLVGTFIGLLGTLSELSAVFATLGGGSGGGDATAMFSKMIRQLQGPMEGMGTAFVASLYGLLGSLVIGLVGGGVKRAGERMIADVRVFIGEVLVTDSTEESAPAPGSRKIITRQISVVQSAEQWRSLIGAVREEQTHMREMMAQMGQAFESRLERMVQLAASTNAELREAIDMIATQAEQNVDRLREVRNVEARLLTQFDEASASHRRTLEAVSDEPERPWHSRLSRSGAVVAIGAGTAALLAGGAGALLWWHQALAPRPMPTLTPTTRPSLSAPVAERAGVPVSHSSAESARVLEVQANPGDTLGGIARLYGVPLEALRKANPAIGPAASITPGSLVKLPALPAHPAPHARIAVKPAHKHAHRKPAAAVPRKVAAPQGTQAATE